MGSAREQRLTVINELETFAFIGKMGYGNFMKRSALSLLIIYMFFTFVWHDNVCYSEEAETSDKALSYDELLAERNAIKADRDNVLIQTHKLLQFKRNNENAAEQINKLNAAIEEHEGQYADLLSQIEIREAEIAGHKAEKEQLQQEKLKLINEKAVLEELTSESKAKDLIIALKKENEAKIREIKNTAAEEVKKVKGDLADLKNVHNAGIKGLKAREEELTKKLAGLNEKSTALEEQVYEKELVIADLEEKVAELEYENEEASGKIKSLEKESRSIPSKFSKLAKQNKALNKQLANVHYNQALFYCENKDFRRAAKEFRQVIDLRPFDKDAIFNLGLIYAEHRVDREKAIEYMKRYIQLDNTSANADLAKRYILKWEAWRRQAKEILH